MWFRSTDSIESSADRVREMRVGGSASTLWCARVYTRICQTLGLLTQYLNVISHAHGGPQTPYVRREPSRHG